MDNLEFFKLSGAGNDFIALCKMPAQDPSDLARSLCRRGVSVGADGLFILERINERDTKEVVSLRMSHWNADGGASDLCLNGTRCAAALAFELGWNRAAQVEIQTGAGPVLAERTATGVRARVPTPSAPELRLFEREGQPPAEGFVCSSGVPHVVRLLDQAAWQRLDINAEGAWLRSHPLLGTEGANVNFVLHGTKPTEHTEAWSIRTFERGVEGETLACGTGAVATAAVLSSLNGRAEHRFVTAGGFTLQVSVVSEHWFLEGDARIVMRGQITDGAFG